MYLSDDSLPATAIRSGLASCFLVYLSDDSLPATASSCVHTFSNRVYLSDDSLRNVVYSELDYV